MQFITERLIIRPWKESDAEDLFKYASDPDVGPIAGWPVHKSVEDSLEIIRNVLSADETYAVCLKDDNRAIGSIGIISPMQSHTEITGDERELGFWIGKPFWGQGLIPEAVKCVLTYAFERLNCTAVWCGYYDGNEKSRRCQKKCGFRFDHTETGKKCTAMNDIRTEHFTKICRDDWMTEKKVYEVLEKLGIEYTVQYHEPFFGHEDADKEGYHQPGLNIKNMLVREKKREEVYLVLLNDEQKLDFKRYRPLTGWSNKIHFAGDEDLVKYLGVHSGACSIFGLINDTDKCVTVVLDSYVTGADDEEKISFHPNINTATVTMKVKDLYTFLDWAGNRVIKEFA